MCNRFTEMECTIPTKASADETVVIGGGSRMVEASKIPPGVVTKIPAAPASVTSAVVTAVFHLVAKDERTRKPILPLKAALKKHHGHHP
mmetsp:Transcript_16509/g.67830  ORF Transcript_16509/g.67830 Transcript_16509/m.67830 type:complete len:89 (-) Transcript_16509:1316-1582(-)